jgi:hypothetical protein
MLKRFYLGRNNPSPYCYTVGHGGYKGRGESMYYPIGLDPIEAFIYLQLSLSGGE